MYTQSSIENALTLLHTPNIPNKERNRADNYLQSFQRSNDKKNIPSDEPWNISLNLLHANTNTTNKSILKYFGAQCLYEIGVRNNGRNDNRNKEILLKNVWDVLLYTCLHDYELIHVHTKLTLTFVGLYAQQQDNEMKYNILDVLTHLQSCSSALDDRCIMYASIMVLSLYIEELYNPSLAVCKTKRYKLQEEADGISKLAINKLNEYFTYSQRRHEDDRICVLLFQGVKNWIQYSNNQLFNISNNVIIQESMNVLATSYNHDTDMNDDGLYNEAFELLNVLIIKIETTLSSEDRRLVEENKTSINTISTWIIDQLLLLSTWKVCKKVVILICDIFQCIFNKDIIHAESQYQLLNRLADILQHTSKLSIVQMTFPCWILYFDNNSNHENIRNTFFHILLFRTQYPVLEQHQHICHEDDEEEWEDFREEMRQFCRDLVHNNATLCDFLTTELSNQLHYQFSNKTPSSWNIIESYIHAYSAISRYIKLDNENVSSFLTWLFTTIADCEDFKHNIPIYKSISIFVGVLIDWITYDCTHRLHLVTPILFQALSFPDYNDSKVYSMKLKQDHVAIVAFYKLFRKDVVKQYVQRDWKMHLLQLYQYNFQLIMKQQSMDDENIKVLLEHSSHQLLLRTLLQVSNDDILQSLLQFLFHDLLHNTNIPFHSSEKEGNANDPIDFSVVCMHWKILSECSYENIVLQRMEMYWSTTLQPLFQCCYSNSNNGQHHLQVLIEFLISLYMHHQNNALSFVQISLPFFQNILQTPVTNATNNTYLILTLPLLNAMAIALPIQNVNDFHLVLQDNMHKYYFVYYSSANLGDTSTISEALVQFFERMGESNPMYVLHTNTMDLIIHFFDICDDIPSKFQLLQILCRWYEDYSNTKNTASNTNAASASTTCMLSSHLHPFFMHHGSKWMSFILTTMRHAQFQHLSLDSFLIFYKTVIGCNNNDVIPLWIDACFQEYPAFPRENTSIDDKIQFKNQLLICNGHERKLRRVLRSFVGRG